MKYCLALSVLFHLAIAALSTLIHVAPRRAEDVMVVEMADLPRSTDFLPPKPGIIEGARPAPAPKRGRAVAGVQRPAPRPEERRGPVPELPVDPGLAPRKDFPAPRTQPEPQPPRPDEPPARAARAPDRVQDAKPPSPPKDAPAAAGGGAHKSLRDLTPTLGTMVMARADRGAGRGQDASRGTAAGTDAKARDKGEIAEERGGGAYLESLNAPEIQYISYFDSIRRKIELVWQYPNDAAAAGLQGDLRINFVIGRDGRLESLDLLDGSGHKVLDDEAKRAIRAAAPFDPIPAQYKIPNLQIRAHFVYEMYTLRIR